MQSGSLHHGQGHVEGLAQAPAGERGLRHGAEQAREGRDLVEVQALEGHEAVAAAVVELARRCSSLPHLAPCSARRWYIIAAMARGRSEAPARRSLPPLRPPLRGPRSRCSSCAPRRRAADREVVGLLASALAFGNVQAIKASIGRVLAALGPAARRRPCGRLDPKDLARRLRGLQAPLDLRPRRGLPAALRWADAARRTGRSRPSSPWATRGRPGRGRRPSPPSRPAPSRLDHGGLYRGRGLPAGAGVRFLLPSPEQGSACKRMNLYLRWMVRRDSVDLGPLVGGASPRRS